MCMPYNSEISQNHTDTYCLYKPIFDFFIIIMNLIRNTKGFIMAEYNYDFDYQSAIESYTTDFQTKFGRQKFDKIHRKIQTSKKVSSLIYLSGQQMLVPNEKDILYCLNEIPYFIFSKADTLAIGGLLSLQRWNTECNSKYHLANSERLLNIANSIIQDCSRINFKR